MWLEFAIEDMPRERVKTTGEGGRVWIQVLVARFSCGSKMNAMQNFTVRQVEEHDHAQVAGLMAELGYPIPAEVMRRKIQEILASDIDCAYVAEGDGRIVGVVSVHALPLLHTVGSLGRITALVVTSSHQRAGVGSKLVEAAEAFARGKNCLRMEVTSGGHREGAHEFYRRIGYDQTTHGRFIRGLQLD